MTSKRKTAQKNTVPVDEDERMGLLNNASSTNEKGKGVGSERGTKSSVDISPVTVFEDRDFNWKQNTFKVVDALFKNNKQLVRHQIDSFDDFILHRVPEILEEINNNDKINSLYVDWDKEKRRHNVQFRFQFGRFYITKPVLNEQDGKERIMYPKDARLRNLTYASSIFVDVHPQIIKFGTRSNTPELIEIPVVEKVNIGKLPIMLQSSFCALYKKPPRTLVAMGECEFDEGGYFIVSGSEKVVVAQERMCENKIYVFPQPKQSTSKYTDIAEIKCIQEGCSVPVRVAVMITTRENNFGHTIKVSVPKIRQDIPLFIMYRALGIVSDRDILEYIAGNLNNSTAKLLIQYLHPSLEEASSITTETAALRYISHYLMLPGHMKNLDEKDEGDMNYKLAYTKSVIVQDLFTHLGEDVVLKSFFLGHMTAKLLKAHLGIIQYEDRDSFMNKRVDTTGPLLAKLFRQNFTRLINDAKKQLKKVIEDGKYSEIAGAIQKAIKPVTIEQNIKTAMATGNWGLKNNPNNAQGVAQLLTRLTYASFMSHLRRVIAPIEKQMKISQPRKLHNSQFFYIDPSETPEGSSIGIVKNLALSTIVTRRTSSDPLIEALYHKGMKPLGGIDKREIGNICKVFVNGSWLGVHDDPPRLVREMRNLRRKGSIDIYCSISWHIEQNELNILSDAGRLTRPLYIVKNNHLLIDNDIINKLEDEDLGWDDLITGLRTKNDEAVIEYIDVEESDTVMIAMTGQDLKDNKPDNDIFYRYSHAEIDTKLMFGVVIGNMPFPDHNQGPRNTYQGAQGKQAIGIYASNFARRMDTVGHILYYPQKPIVYPRMSKYLHGRELPSGVNIVVAIACYTGYNMEDSLIMNQTAIDHGLFVSSYYRKYEDKEKKNQTALDDEKFMKPEEYYSDGVNKKTKGMKASNYELLDEHGFVRVGSRIKGNDVIIGKVIPRKITREDEPRYIDASTTVKSNESGVVDWVYSNRDPDGYRFVKIRTRTERQPEIGDKFSCYTPDHDILTMNRGWVSIADITTKDRVATLVDGSKLVYKKPTEVMSYDFDGELYVVDSAQVSLSVTPNHRMYVSNREGTNFQIKKAEDCYQKRWKYLKNCEKYKPKLKKANPNHIKNLKIENNKVTHFLIFNSDGSVAHEFPINDWCVFFGIWIAEGSTSAGGTRVSSHKKRVRSALNKIEKSFNKSTGITFAKREYIKEYGGHVSYRIYNKNIFNYFDALSVGAVNKSLPNWVWYLNTKQSKKLIKGMILGDGCYMENGTERYYTSSIKLRDDFQKLCLHAGWSANCYLKSPAGTVSSRFKVNGEENKIGHDIVTTTDYWTLTVVKTQNKPLINKNLVQSTKKGGNDRYEKYKGKVYCCDVGGDGIIYVRCKGHTVWCGNSRAAQKGTIGITYQACDMPFNGEKGIYPDLIMNPHAIPSRMTIGQLIECITGKVASTYAVDCDASPFTGIKPNDVADALEAAGFDRYGNEVLYNGKTGEQLMAQIFIGPTYYQRLKHMVDDKWHSRAIGPYQLLTHQPAEGRSRDGGLRFGEMERDCMLSHGAMQFLKERMYDVSDKYVVYICKKSGMIAAVNPEKNIYESRFCEENTTDFARIKIPYACKLFLQEMMAMSIVPKLITN